MVGMNLTGSVAYHHYPMDHRVSDDKHPKERLKASWGGCIRYCITSDLIRWRTGGMSTKALYHHFTDSSVREGGCCLSARISFDDPGFVATSLRSEV